MTTKYETIVVAAPTLSEEENGALVSSLESTIAEGKGELIRTEPWGKKRLAYRVEKFEEGYYTLLFYQSPSALVRELERRIRMNDKLIRYITVKVDWEEKVARAEALRATSRRPASSHTVDELALGELDSADEAGEFEGGRE